MAKKKHPKRNVVAANPKGSDKLLATMFYQIQEEQYEEAIKNGEMLLNYLPKNSPLLADALDLLGSAYAATENYIKNYEVTDALVALQPNDPVAWYNHGLASFFTSRIGHAVRDFDRAEALDTTGMLASSSDGTEMVDTVRMLGKDALERRGENFTLDQLIQQENIYQQGLKYMDERKWQEAEDAFRKTVAIADVLPQPWANIAGTLILRERYDEAEIALKRALEIDPDYELAKHNLRRLPELRKNGLPEEVSFYDPFVGSTTRKI